MPYKSECRKNGGRPVTTRDREGDSPEHLKGGVLSVIGNSRKKALHRVSGKDGVHRLGEQAEEGKWVRGQGGRSSCYHSGNRCGFELGS